MRHLPYTLGGFYNLPTSANTLQSLHAASLAARDAFIRPLLLETIFCPMGHA